MVEPGAAFAPALGDQKVALLTHPWVVFWAADEQHAVPA